MRPVRHVTVAIITTAVMGLAASASAAAAPGSVLLDTVPGPAGELAGDGTRWVAYKADAHTIRVYDLLRARSWDAAVDPACSPRDGYGGRMLVACAPPPGSREHPGPFVLDLRSRRYERVRSHDRASGFDTFFRMGRHWLEGFEDQGRAPGRTYLNWRSGEYRKGDSDVATRNIDARPLPRISTRGWFGQSGPYYLTHRDDLVGRGRPLELRRKRRDGRRVLSRCSGNPGCRHMQLSWFVATWTERRRVYAYNFRSGRRFRWEAGAATDVVHTRDRVVFTETDTSVAGAPVTRLYVARTPRS